jgi:hypothetical protein
MSFRPLMVSATGAILCVVAGCASQGPKPTDELTKAHTVVEQADKGNAQRYAAADLQRAHDELSEADRADAQKRYKEARSMAQRAEVDADVAMARGNSGDAQKAADEIRQSNKTLREESNRPSGMSSPSTQGTTAPPQRSATPEGTTTTTEPPSPGPEPQ